MTPDEVRARGVVCLQVQDVRNAAIIGFMVLTVSEVERLVGYRRVKAGLPTSDEFREAAVEATYGKSQSVPW